MSAIANAVQDAGIGDCFRRSERYACTPAAPVAPTVHSRRRLSGFDHRIDVSHNIHTSGGIKLLAMALGNCRAGGVVFWEATCSSWVGDLKPLRIRRTRLRSVASDRNTSLRCGFPAPLQAAPRSSACLACASCLPHPCVCAEGQPRRRREVQVHSLRKRHAADLGGVNLPARPMASLGLGHRATRNSALLHVNSYAPKKQENSNPVTSAV
jgi:hypothetical protein